MRPASSCSSVVSGSLTLSLLALVACSSSSSGANPGDTGHALTEGSGDTSALSPSIHMALCSLS